MVIGLSGVQIWSVIISDEQNQMTAKQESDLLITSIIMIMIIIITLFESQIILAEHECCTNWGDCKSNESNQIMITDRIGQHDILLPINHNHYNFPEK